jgi:hypothetical protein
MTRSVYGHATNVTFSCGLGVVGGFRFNRANIYGENLPSVADLAGGGTGYHVAAFVNEPESKAAYAAIRNAHRLVFQSEVRINRNSGRDFFFIIYDTR